MERLLSYIESNRASFLEELKQFLSIPSISSQTDHNDDTRRCAEWITDDKGKVVVDFIGKYENFDEDWKIVCEKIGIKAKLPHRNKSKHRHYSVYYTKEARQVIAERFKEDIKMFGYKFEKSNHLYNLKNELSLVFLPFAYEETQQKLEALLQDKFPNTYQKMKMLKQGLF